MPVTVVGAGYRRTSRRGGGACGGRGSTSSTLSTDPARSTVSRARRSAYLVAIFMRGTPFYLWLVSQKCRFDVTSETQSASGIPSYPARATKLENALLTCRGGYTRARAQQVVRPLKLTTWTQLMSIGPQHGEAGARRTRSLPVQNAQRRRPHEPRQSAARYIIRAQGRHRCRGHLPARGLA